MKLTAQMILAALQEGQGGSSANRFQEAREGKIVRVADLKYLKEAKGKEGLEIGMTEAMASVVEGLSDVFLSEGFADLDSLADMARENYVAMGEATAASAFGQLFRAGVQMIANDWYLRTGVSWTEYIQEVTSSNRQEFYAPMNRSTLPQLTQPQQPYKEQPVSGRDVELVNQKYMGGESFEAELWEDDQTGQIRTRAQGLGESQRILEEIFAAGTILGLTDFSVANFSVPAPVYADRSPNGTAITTPYSTSLFAGSNSVGNKFSTGKALSGVSFKQARAALMNAVDPNGIKVLVRPNHIVVSTQDDQNARTLIESDYWPAVQGLDGTTSATAVSGGLAGAFAKNTFKGLVTASVNYFFRDWAWVMGEKRKGMIFQRRSPMSVIQENPMSGASFELDAIRFRSRARWTQGWINSRFWFLGNNGETAGSQ